VIYLDIEMSKSGTITIYLCDNRSVLLNRDGGAMAYNGGSFSIEHYIMVMAWCIINGVHHMKGIHGSHGNLDSSI